MEMREYCTSEACSIRLPRCDKPGDNPANGHSTPEPALYVADRFGIRILVGQSEKEQGLGRWTERTRTPMRYVTICCA